MIKADYVTELRGMLSDTDGSKNILNHKLPQYSDTQLEFFISRGLKDVNSGLPATNYALEDFPEDDLLVNAALIQVCIAEGFLQLRNQIDYNDAGLSISLFNKTSGYQSWAGFLLTTYLSDKDSFKKSIIGMQAGSGFLGIQSQFSSEWGTY